MMEGACSYSRPTSLPVLGSYPISLTQGLYSCNYCFSFLHSQLVPLHWNHLIRIQKGYNVLHIFKNPPLILESPGTAPCLYLSFRQNSFKELFIFPVSNSGPLIFFKSLLHRFCPCSLTPITKNSRVKVTNDFHIARSNVKFLTLILFELSAHLTQPFCLP